MSKNTANNINKRNIPYSVSQNFLTSSSTVRKLLNLTSISKDDFIIEIGTGKGHITQELIKICGFAETYEIDTKLYGQLKSKFEYADNLKIIHQDFLKASLPQRQPYKIFANIPFCFTSEIMRKLTTAPNPPSEVWLVMEKGAAKRFAGKPNDTLSSLTIKPFFDCDIKYHFRREDFHPMPSVDTVLLHFKLKPESDIHISDKKHFSDFIQKGMNQGINALMTKKQISTALKFAELPPIHDSGVILYIQWLCLFRCYRRFHGGK